jgi:hypothetical protein
LKKRTRSIIILLTLPGLVVFGGWLLSSYASTKAAVADATEILHAALSETPGMSVEQAESILVELSRAGMVNIRILSDSIPGDVFGNLLHIELIADSTGIMVYCMSTGIDGLRGTFDDIGCSVASGTY